MKRAVEGVINRDEAYSKAEVLARLGISQRFWDKLLDEGVPYTSVGHTRWVTGQALFDYLEQHAERRQSSQLPSSKAEHSTHSPSPLFLSPNAKEIEMVQIKLSEKPCLFCSKTETVVVKAPKENFQAPVCMEHLRPLLQKWEDQPEQK
jgi:hypothetical protein